MTLLTLLLLSAFLFLESADSNTSSSFNLSLSSIIIFCAVLGPIPGSALIAATSSARTANLKSSAVILDNAPSAALGPIPLTQISILNMLKSSLVRNPNRLHSSSLTFIYVYILTSLPTDGSSPRTEPGTYILYPIPLASTTITSGRISESSPLMYEIILYPQDSN